MGRLFSRWLGLAVSLLLLSSLFGCGSSKSTSTEANTPATVTLSPRPEVSLELGNTQSFTVTTLDRNGTALSPAPPVTFVSSNPTVLTVSAGGLACAGKWDSLSNPVVCTPGGEGVAVVTAVSKGVSSPPATIHVHQHIDSIVISPVPNQTTNLSTCNLGPNPIGLSKGTDTFDFQATAYSRRGGPPPGLDITGTVGPFSWQTTTGGVVSVSSTGSGLRANQARVTTTNPGVTEIFATNSNVTSQTLSFTVCPVQSIALELSGGGGNTFTETSGSKAITATVIDTDGVEITSVPLTWSSSNAAAFTATTGSTSSVKPGGATIIASCTPPSCNIGFTPPLPIYPEGVITAEATGTGTVTTTSVWVASSSCKLNGVNDDNCVSNVLPIDTSKNTVGIGADLPSLPNSFSFDRQGAKAYLGTDKGFQSTHGLAILTPGSSTAALTVSQVLTAPGKVLAISPDGKQVIVSDTADVPNQVFVVGPSATPPTVTPLPITGATAADFSPDSYKAYIAAGDKLYVYSAFEALKTIQLNGTATDVSFLSNGAFAYVAGGAAGPGVTVFTNCTGTLADTLSTPAVPAFIRTAPNGAQVFALNSPGIDIINVNTTPVGCSPTVSNSVAPSISFGLGPFNATQMIVSSDGRRIYVIADNQNSIIVFNADSQTTSTIGLNAAVPVRAGLTTDGKFLYVIGSDKTIHVVDTATNTDTLQVALPQGLCHAKSGTAAQAYTCDPDLIAVKP